MLCYQFSRNATEIIHDTFRWLRDNGRVTRVMTLILVPLSFVAQWLCASNTDTAQHDLFETLMLYYFPLFSNSVTNSGTMLLFRYLTLLIVVMCIVPILRHYFLSRRSVKRITLPRLGRLILEHFKTTLWVAVLSIAAYFLISLLMYTVVLGYALLIVMVFPMSASIMHGMSWRLEGFTDNWKLAIRYLFLASFVVIVLQIFPVYIIGLAAAATAILEESVGFVVPYIADLHEEIGFIMGVFSYLMFGYSMMVLFVSLTLFHGTVAEEDEI